MCKISMSSSSLVLSVTIAIILVAQVNQTSTKSVFTSKDERDNKKVSLLDYNKDMSINEVIKKDVAAIQEEGRAKKKYSYYYLGRSVLYFILYYQLFYNFYFLAHIARSAFLHRISQPPGHLQYYKEKVSSPWWGNLIYESLPSHHSARMYDNDQPTYEINQKGIHNLTMTVLNAIQKFEKDYSK